MRLGLFLGGGGVVGVAWEHGMLAALADEADLRPADSTIIVGTSAGSLVGAQIALGRDGRDVLALDEDADTDLDAQPTFDTENALFKEIIDLILAPGERGPEWVERISDLALRTADPVKEDAFVEMFRRGVGTDAWPATDLRVTTACCETAEPKVWSAADDIALSRAIASSCAIPGFFPPISIEGLHYFDGARGRRYHTEIVADLHLDAALFIGPRVPISSVESLVRDDMDALAATGVRTHTIYGSERLEAEVANLMDRTKRRLGFEIGLADGAAHADAVAALLGT